MVGVEIFKEQQQMSKKASGTVHTRIKACAAVSGLAFRLCRVGRYPFLDVFYRWTVLFETIASLASRRGELVAVPFAAQCM